MGPYKNPERKLYCIVAIGYFTKWVEAKFVTVNDEKTMAEFLLKKVFLTHGAPEALVTDQATQFMSQVFKTFALL